MFETRPGLRVRGGTAVDVEVRHSCCVVGFLYCVVCFMIFLGDVGLVGNGLVIGVLLWLSVVGSRWDTAR